jgi:hypothetical protein
MRGPGRPVSAFTRAAVEAIGAADAPTERSLDGRWQPVHEALELVVEVAAAAQLYGIHRRIALETGLSGVDASRGRVRDACEDVLRLLLAAHEVLGADRDDVSARVAAVADRHEAHWAFDPDEGLALLPTVLTSALSTALTHRGTARDVGPALVDAAGAALALWLLAGEHHEPLGRRAV